MNKMKVISLQDDKILLVGKNKFSSCTCTISNLRMSELEPTLKFDIDWIEKGVITNLQRKKMVSRSVISLLRKSINEFKANTRFEKIS